MDVSGISASTVSHDLQTKAASDIKSHDNGTHHHHEHENRSHRSRQGRALSIFRQELQSSFRMHFRAKIAISQTGYSSIQGGPNSEDVATEALGAASQLVSEAPTRSGKALISFRAKIHESASVVRETVSQQDDLAAVDDAMSRIDEGLDALEKEVSASKESSASVLEVDRKSKQRSTIRIRTQEGDIVKLSLKRTDRVSATDTATINGDESASTTEVEISSRTRLTLRVDGDLNESELAAIQNVFAQAEEIANQFFDGDISAAFDLATGFEFDTEQLARVRMRFRSYESTNISYTESTNSAPAITAPTSPATPAASQAPAEVKPVDVTPEPAQPTAEDQVVANTEPSVEAPPAPAIDTSVFDDFFSLLSDFLRSIGDGFENAGGSGEASIRLHYSESFKLEILASVIHVTAPDDAEEPASTATTLIENISAVDATQPEVV